ncbi:MAG: hypothetical protein SFV19_15605 [Rhodospirillaceae bacterium]|nr:hypothetical protein [Rhodospirillaceae bacterium]
MASLKDLIVAESQQPSFPAAAAFARDLAERYGVGAAAVLFYGSCLRQATDQGLMLDFYVLVGDLDDAILNPVSKILAKLLPPNVYYHEMPYEGRILRAKVAVMTLDRFCADTLPTKITSSTWARFAQPTRIVWVYDPDIRRQVETALANAAKAMMINTLPLMPKTFSARDLWVRALSETYAAELRPESPAKAAELVDADLPRYVAVTEAVFGEAPAGGLYTRTAPPGEADEARKAWRRRRVWGKVLNVLRLIKAAFTFRGGLDYAVWKIERHSGVKIALTERQRRHPVLTGLWLLPQLLRRGGIK